MWRDPRPSPSRAGTTRHGSSPRTSPASSELGLPARVGLFLATVLVIVALALLPLLTPWFMHAALDAAGAAERLGLTAAQAFAASDGTLHDLLLGGSFELALPDGAPFYDVDERSHLADARLLLGLTLVAGGVSLLALAGALVAWPLRRRSTWRVVRYAGLATALTTVLLGLASLVAFDSLFTLFHQVFFPGGNWSFDPSTQRLVQLYPVRFWQIAAAAFGTLVILLGLAAWLLGRWASRPRSG